MGSLEEKTIYAIQHNITKRIYVGCSLHYEKRIREHICHLRNGNHSNKELQKDYDLYGENYSYFVIERNVKFSGCFDREKMWMSILKSNEYSTRNTSDGDLRTLITSWWKPTTICSL